MPEHCRLGRHIFGQITPVTAILQRFKSAAQAQKFLAASELILSAYTTAETSVAAFVTKHAMMERMHSWREITGLSVSN